MVAARMPLCSVSVITRSTNFSLAVAEKLFGVAVLAFEGAAVELAAVPADPDVAGVPATAPEPSLLEAGDALEPLGAEVLLGFAASPAACLHRSDNESWCALRQATTRPPPGCTPAHSF
jgi:hypothetical protein